MDDLPAKVKAQYDALIGPLKAVALEHGYTLVVHGSLARDIDLIAVPWVEEAAAAADLAEAIRAKAEEVAGFAFLNPRQVDEFPRRKPHGRLCWAFHLGGGPYIDLSVLPIRPVPA